MIRQVRHACRALLGRPAGTIAAVVTVALGVGANTAVFSVVNALLLRDPPYRDADRILRIVASDDENPFKGEVGGPSYVAWRDETRAFELLAAYNTVSASLTGAGDPVRLTGAAVTSNLFSALGVGPLLGRTLRPEEELPGGSDVVILSETLWERRFSRSEDVVGRLIRLDGRGCQVVGVMPMHFVFPSPEMQFWIPLNAHAQLTKSPDGRPVVSVPKLRLLGRLAANATPEQARNEARHALAREGRHIAVMSLKDDLVGPLKPALLALQGMVAIVLLMACANLASLLLARGMELDHAVAVRVALGASRVRAARELLVETMLLGLAGGGAGTFLAWLLFAILPTVDPLVAARIRVLQPDITVLLTALALSLVTGLLSGLVPVVRASRADIVSTLHGAGGYGASSGRTPRGTPLLICMQLVLALVLSTAAATLIRGFVALVSGNPGFDRERVATADIRLPRHEYMSSESRIQLFDRLANEARTVPGVEVVSLTNWLPLRSGNGLFALSPPPEHLGLMLIRQNVVTRLALVGHGYFSVLRIPAVYGRLFGEDDTATSLPVVVLSRAVAERSFGGRRAVGQTLEYQERLWTIIGLAGDVEQDPMRHGAAPLAYFLYAQVGLSRLAGPLDEMSLLARTRGDPGAVLEELSRRAQQVDPSLVVDGVSTLEARLHRSIGPVNLFGSVMTGFAVLALVMAGIGLFGLLSQTVSRRSREIGIRMALGAGRGTVLWAVVREGMILTGAATLVGWPLAVTVNHFLHSVFVGLPPPSIAALAGASAVLAAVALLACAVPARRATQIEPAQAARAE